MGESCDRVVIAVSTAVAREVLAGGKHPQDDPAHRAWIESRLAGDPADFKSAVERKIKAGIAIVGVTTSHPAAHGPSD